MLRVFLLYLFTLITIDGGKIFAELLPRNILALYDSRVESAPDVTFAHLICEMPLNYLGMDLIYHDLKMPLPDLSSRPDIRGILTCFPHEMGLDDPILYLEWAERAIDLGKRFVILQDPGFKKNRENKLTSPHLINAFYKKLGFYDRNDWSQYTFQYQVIHKNNTVVEFEHPYPAPLPPFSQTARIHPAVVSFLTLRLRGEVENRVDLVMAGPNGGYVSQYYASTYTKQEQAPEARYWYINPFQFFRLAFGIESFPVPDPTTLAGRRIFYSQINGDAWNSPSEIESYRQSRATCSQVLYREILSRYPDLPFSLGIIAADVDLNWVGSSTSQESARQILTLDNIEAASHTYSHPFDWKFFQENDQQKREVSFLYLYPYGSWQSSYLSWLRAAYYLQRGHVSINEKNLGIGYVTPRAYANLPFDLQREIIGSCEWITQLAPAHKKVTLFQWTGDCHPWDSPLAMTRQMTIRNLNGGSVRKDAEAPSYCNVSPLARKVGSHLQIYSSANDENAYTFDWTGRFYGFKYVTETFQNTETPLRIKPLNLFFHTYSAQKEASLNALKDNLAYIKKEPLIAVWPSRYAAAADGFFSLTIDQLAPLQWRFFNRDGLQTIRFDNPNMSVDYKKSKGIVGHCRSHKALYIYLDAADPTPLLSLGESEEQSIPYLIESTWEIWDVKRTREGISCLAQGWGPLKMIWQLPQIASYQLKAHTEDQVYETKSIFQKDRFAFELPLPSNRTFTLNITRDIREL